MDKAPSDSARGEICEPGKKNTKAKLPKRFYSTVSVAQHGDGFVIHLDERRVRTPAGQELCVPTQALAQTVAQEWERQKDVIDPTTMPITKLCNSALDGAVAKRDVVIESLANLANHDAVCYRAEQPTGLVALQGEAWDPIIDWARDTFGVRWVCAGGVMPVTQPPEAVEQVKEHLDHLNPFQLVAVHELGMLSDSVLLPLAYCDSAISFEDLWRAANLDEDWQREQWGEDEEAAARRRARTKDAEAADLLYSLVSGGHALGKKKP